MWWYTPEFLGTKPFWGIVAAAVVVSAGTGVVYIQWGLTNRFVWLYPRFEAWRHSWTPGPLMGATGLPMLLAYGVYRLVRRHKG